MSVNLRSYYLLWVSAEIKIAGEPIAVEHGKSPNPLTQNIYL